MNDDELDAQLRGAMKVLDAEVPSGYFDTRPSEVLSHLETRSMDPTPMPTPRTPDAAPPVAAREEDSGLHDIKNLAQSTKQRLSKKITVPPVSDDDLIASSSAGWKAVALPEPAKMISLPELAELPSKKIIKEQQKAEKKVVAPVVVTDAPKAAVAVEKPAIGASQPKSKTPLYAAIGVGLVAAAGGLIYIATSGGSKEPAPVVAKNDTPPPVVAAKPAPAPTATPIEVPPPPAPVAEVEAPVAAPPPVETAPATVSKKPPAKSKGADVHKVEITNQTAAPAAKPAAPEKKVVEKPAGKEGEPNFDDLLKEAGVKDGPKAAKPVLEKKSLSGGDFKNGMAGITSKAQACYAGTQGTAAVKLTVGPDGHVTKASVSGAFAGTPVAACVEAAVRSATFPAWDGGPQSFGYSFLLSE